MTKALRLILKKYETMAEIAREIDVHYITVYQWYTGVCKPNERNAMKLVRLMDGKVTVKQLRGK